MVIFFDVQPSVFISNIVIGSLFRGVSRVEYERNSLIGCLIYWCLFFCALRERECFNSVSINGN